MQINNILPKDYTAFQGYYQLKLPLNIECIIPNHDSVRLLSQFVEELDLSKLYSTYFRIRKNSATPRQMMKIMLYAYMNHLYSAREIGKACRRDINFMYLLENAPAPDHRTIARFRTLHFADCAKELLAAMSQKLLDAGEISGNDLFIDGTKIEAVSNKYTFVWKKSVSKYQQKLLNDLTLFVAQCESLWHSSWLLQTAANTSY